MPGRSRRLPLSIAYGLAQGSPAYGLAPGGERGSTLLRERRPAPPPASPEGGDAQGSGAGGQDSAGTPQGSSPQDDNPFAPPPEGTPDRPWQPRHDPNGQDSDQGSGQGRSPWGRQWSDEQPGRSPGGFGERPGGQGGGPEGPPGMRWDPTDPVQRRARYALLSGMWAFFFALFSWPYVALLLGALALYWGISSLRAKPRTPDPTAPAPAAGSAAGGPKPQTTAAISGLVTAALALAMVAATFAAQLVYRDYYTCVSDALTNSAKQSCERLLPEEVRPLLGTRD
ncbi:hypothetical protein ABT009_14390 [Streptomyces sp. NPDC002896]|uniref:hypothetical protein n=1 Tax=Streptomyces sp. NPDC002896 TaxID=3154438 RepID=UPI0033232FD6